MNDREERKMFSFNLSEHFFFFFFEYLLLSYEDVYKPLALDDCSCAYDQLTVLLKREFFLFAQQLHEIASDGENSTASTSLPAHECITI